MMSKPVKVPTLMKCNELFDKDEALRIHSELLKSNFRSAASLYDQIQYLKSIRPNLSIRTITNLLTISNNRYYATMKINEVPSPEKVRSPPNQLLTEKEEESIIQSILIQQLQNDCWDGKDIRNAASQMFHERTCVERVFSRDWLRDFRSRHKDQIEKIKADSLEEKRANISISEVENYFNEIEELMKDPPNPFLLINFDETGFEKRPQKGKRKSIYVAKKCNVEPFYREQTEPHHISLVVGVSAACCDITPLFLSTRKKLDADINDTFFHRRATYFQTRKGYMTIESTVFWVRNNLGPYVDYVRKLLGSDLRCVVICDGLSSHFNPLVQEALDQIGNIKMIPIPAHSSHLSQVLDLTILNVLKMRYNSIQNSPQYASNFTKKLMRIKTAYQSVMFDETIRAGWERAGFHLTLTDGEVSNYEFKEEFKAKLRAAALHQDITPNE